MIRCLFKQSDITPCVIEDGAVCYSAPPRPVCVGCTRAPEAVNEDLAARGHDPIDPPPPGDRTTVRVTRTLEES